jgi:flagellin-specific chaperone FliS
MNELKRQYNELLMRYMKAEYYFEDTSISNEDKEKHIPKAKEIINGLNKLLEQIKTYTSDEVLNGFQYTP